MAFQFLQNMPLDEAKTLYLTTLLDHGFAPAEETIPVGEALGRITARAVYAHICAPHYHASAMDGIAVRAADTFGATETTPVVLPPSQFKVLDTGDPIPEGCDAVIMVEDVVYEEDGSARLYAPAAPWQHIRQIGEDVCTGEMLLPSRTAVTPAAMGALLAGGVLEIPVYRRPVVGILPTGDEIIPPTTDPAPGQIMEFNSTIFSAMVQEWGAVPKTYPITRDNLEDIRARVAQAAEECDMVLLNAGSSAGREDYSCQAISEVGEVLCHGIAIKPGKPAILGCKGPVPILGVPGYPVSGILVIRELLQPLVEHLTGRTHAQVETAEAVLSRPVVSGLKYREFIRLRLGYVGDKLMASPLSRGSGVVTSFMKADGILEVPQGTEGYENGQTVTVQLLRPKAELQKTLVVIGSHDPLMDELADLFRLDGQFYLSSSHVGSMGGIMAIRRGEAHMGGVHLLDEKDGSYNTAFIRKYFPNGGVRLVECVGRTQGLMLAAGNPKGIEKFADLAQEGISYVNRQKGSGTRILFDYLCKQEHVDGKAIYGYDREEFTHTAVAAQIANGSGDAGMGIWSAAQLYGLEFLPICTEQYDLLIPDSAWDTPMVQKLLEVLRSDTFRARLEALGGYTVNNPGTVREL